MKLSDFWIRNKETDEGEYLIAIPFEYVSVVEGNMFAVYDERFTLAIIVQLITLLQMRYPEQKLAMDRLTSIFDELQDEA